jgi:hypothetical protein
VSVATVVACCADADPIAPAMTKNVIRASAADEAVTLIGFI